jgi:hypothetical protein
MQSRRKYDSTDKNDIYNSPIIYTRRLSDKIFIAICIVFTLIYISFGFTDIKDISPPFVVLILIFSIFFGIISSRIAEYVYRYLRRLFL